MRLLIAIMTVALSAVMLLAACNSHEQTQIKTANPAATPQHTLPPGDNVRRITPDELKTAMASNNAILIDVRDEATYKREHIKGARIIPYNEILAHLDDLPRDKTIATYCS